MLVTVKFVPADRMDTYDHKPWVTEELKSESRLNQAEWVKWKIIQSWPDPGEDCVMLELDTPEMTGKAITTRERRTPGAIFHTSIKPDSVGCTVALPDGVRPQLDTAGAKKLEDKIHDAMEGVLAEFFE